MTTSPTPTAPTPAGDHVPPAKKPRPGWLMPVLFTVAGIVILLIGVGIGVASQQSKINSYKHQAAQLQGRVTQLHGQVTTEKANLATEQTKVTTAQTAAQNAMSTALAQVRAQYKSKFAALQVKEQKVASAQARLNHALGVVAKSTISADGVYVVGRDIPSGVYHTSGNGGGFSNQCYYATLGSTNTGNILDNNNFNGPETVDVSGAYAFQIVGGCVWHKIG